jgi:hypothetical protein
MMAKNTQKKQDKINQLLVDLTSNNIAKVKTTLDALELIGNETVIFPILRAINPSESHDEKNQLLIEFLSTIKDSEIKETIINALSEAEFKPIRGKILSVIWNIPLDFSEYLDYFVRIAIEGNFMESLECLTILENLEGPFEEEQLMEAQVILSGIKDQKFDNQKATIVSEIALLIKSFIQRASVDDLEEFN